MPHQVIIMTVLLRTLPLPEQLLFQYVKVVVYGLLYLGL